MREILFRGKRMDNGEWVEGFYCKHDTVKVCFSSEDPNPKHLIIQDGFCDWGFEPPLHGVEVNPETVGQFTGLTDKNGKKIFEGDIVRHHNDTPYAIPAIIEKGKVYWDKKTCGWRRTSNGAFNHGIIDAYQISTVCVYEVIGNIHDNPELLEAQS